MNVERHADATSVIVRWEVADGIRASRWPTTARGFDTGPQWPASITASWEYHERADAIGAQLAIESRPGQGTKVAVELTLRDQQASERRSA